MGTSEWLVIGFIIFVLIVIVVVYFVARWLDKAKKEEGQ